MNLPPGFGAFWPDGVFEGEGERPGTSGWSERLNKHYYASPLEERKRLFAGGASAEPTVGYAYYVSQKFIGERGKKGDGDPNPLSAIEPQEAPRFFQTLKSYSALGALIKLNDRILATNLALKEIIERLEPARHQFFPIEIRMPRGRIFPEEYFTISVGYMGSFSLDDSKDYSYISYPDYPGFYNFHESKKAISGLAFMKSAFDGAHLWRERAFRENLLCFSDELVAEIAKAELRIPKHYKMKEV